MDFPYMSRIMSCNSNQQARPYLQNPQRHWLLQQPYDSGYVEGDEDLFAQAFRSCEPQMKMIDDWITESQSTSALSISSTTSSPFEYADSLVLPSEEWQPYDTSNTGYYLNGTSYDMTGYHNDMTIMAAAPATQQTMFQEMSQKAVPQVTTLQPSLMEDSCSLPESPVLGRPRREHHTAVEQRYRKNLNQQFNNLRSAVPNIQTSQPQRGGQPAKPSKCEILMGAVNYIKRLEEENQRLRDMGSDDQVSRKRARTTK